MNQRKIGAILSYVSFFISNFVGLIYTPYMLNMMGQSEYGINSTAVSLTAYLSMLSFGIGGAYLRFVSKCRASHDIEGEKRLNGAFLMIFAILGTIVLLCGVGIIAFAEVLVEQTFTNRELRRLQIVLIFGVLNMSLTFLFNPIMMAIQSKERFLFLRIVQLASSICNPILNVVALSMGGRAVALTVVSFVISVACFIAYLFYAIKVLHFSFTFKGIKFAYVREIFIFSSFLFLNSITDQITNSTDNIILSAVGGTAAVAVYAVGAQFRNYFLSFSTSISSVFALQANELVATGQNEEVDNLFIRVGRIQFYVLSLLLIGFALIGHDFICLWAGKDYSEAYMIGLLLMIGTYVPLFQNVGLEIQKAKNKHKARSIVYLFIALGNVAMTIPMAIKWGGIGAALATTICMFVGNVLFMNWYYAKHIHLNIKKFWFSIARILPGFILPIGVGVAINVFWNLDSYVELLLAAGVLTATYVGSVWFFSMNPYEKGLIKAPLKKMLKRGK